MPHWELLSVHTRNCYPSSHIYLIICTKLLMTWKGLKGPCRFYLICNFIQGHICESRSTVTMKSLWLSDTVKEKVKVKVKVKFSLEQATKAQRGSRCIALLFLQLRRQIGVGGQRHAPAALPPGKSRYSLYRRLGGPQGRSGRMRKISPPPGFDPRTIQPVASHYTDWAIPAPECQTWQ